MTEDTKPQPPPVSRLLRPLDPIDVLRDRLDEATTRLTAAARLVNELGGMSKTRPNVFAKEEFLRAVEAATENFGFECGVYADLTEEINITLGTTPVVVTEEKA